jgi:hypothetical protein
MPVGFPQPQGRNPQKTGLEMTRGTRISIYCRNPDGSLIEISSYVDDRHRP